MLKPSTIKKLLKDGFDWPRELITNKIYSRLHDDHDGKFTGNAHVYFGQDGDAYIETNNPDHGPLRFRSGFGGSHSPRVYNALVLLALAIKLDSEAKPDPKPNI